jgi:hypothetical protein
VHGARVIAGHEYNESILLLLYEDFFDVLVSVPCLLSKQDPYQKYQTPSQMPQPAILPAQYTNLNISQQNQIWHFRVGVSDFFGHSQKTVLTKRALRDYQI